MLNSGKGSGKPGEVPDGLAWTQHPENKRCQLEPNQPVQLPYLSQIFPEPDPKAQVEYPRYLREPMVQCSKGHTVYLSRIPWQSGCRECNVPMFHS